MKIYPVDPKEYQGHWKIDGFTGQGAGQVALGSGTHTLELCDMGATFEFEIAADGDAFATALVCTSQSVATDKTGTITFQNVKVTVKANGYQGLETYFGFGKNSPLKKVSDGDGDEWEVSLVKGGTYEFIVADGVKFPFTISSDGCVSVDAAIKAATAKDATLTLQTTPIKIEASEYEWTPGHFGLFYGAQVKEDSDVVTVVNGLSYKFAVAYGATFPFHVGASGTVTVKPSETKAATASGCVLTLNLTSIVIDDRGYEQKDDVLGIFYGPKLKAGQPTIKVVRDIHYRFAVAYSATFPFSVDEHGDVRTDATAAATSNGAKMELQLTDIEIDDGGFQWKSRAFGIYCGPDLMLGSTTLRVPLDVGYRFAVAGGAGFNFKVDEHGNIDATKTKAAEGTGAKLSLQTTDLTFKKTDSPVAVMISSGPSLKGDGTLRLVRSVEFTAKINGAEMKLTVD